MRIFPRHFQKILESLFIFSHGLSRGKHKKLIFHTDFSVLFFLFAIKPREILWEIYMKSVRNPCEICVNIMIFMHIYFNRILNRVLMAVCWMMKEENLSPEVLALLSSFGICFLTKKNYISEYRLFLTAHGVKMITNINKLFKSFH